MKDAVNTSSLVSMLPLTLLESKLRAALIFEAPLKFSNIEILSTAIIVSIIIALIFIFYRKNKQKEI